MLRYVFPLMAHLEEGMALNGMEVAHFFTTRTLPNLNSVFVYVEDAPGEARRLFFWVIGRYSDPAQALKMRYVMLKAQDWRPQQYQIWPAELRKLFEEFRADYIVASTPELALTLTLLDFPNVITAEEALARLRRDNDGSPGRELELQRRDGARHRV